MADIIPYLISTFRGGISDETDKGVHGSFKHGYGLDIHKRADTLSAKQAMATILDATTGVLSPSHTGTTLTSPFNFFVPASDGSTYCFGATGSIFARSGDGRWTFVYDANASTEAGGAILGAAQYALSDGSNYLFWATATSLARKRFIGNDTVPVLDSGSFPWQDVEPDFKTTLDPVDWHTMKVAGGELVIANGNSLAKVDFDGNFLASSMNVRPGNLIKTLDERDDYAILGSGRLDKSEEGHIWSWLIGDIRWKQKKRIPIKGVNALIQTELLLLQGGDDGEIFYSDFINALPLHAVPGGGQVSPGGVSIENDLAVFGFYGGTYPGIWSYGRRMKNRPYSLNYDYRMAKTVGGSTISTIGAVGMVDDILLASWGTTDGSTSEYGVDSVSSTTKATALYEGLEFDGGRPYFRKPFNTVVLGMEPLPSGTSVSVRFKLDRAATGGDSSAGAGWQYAVLGSGATTFSTTDATEAIFSMGDWGRVYEIGLDLNPSSNNTPEIKSITTYLDRSRFEYA